MAEPAYLRDGAAIYERSFAIIRAEADLSRFSRRGGGGRGADDPCLRSGRGGALHRVRQRPRRRGARGAGAGRADPVRRRDGGARHHPGAAAGRATPSSARCAIRACRRSPSVSAPRARLPRSNCGATQLAGAVVAIGNAPTALFRLLEMLDAGAPRPAAILGIPVGFVGAAESKEALANGNHGVPYLVVTGRLGGSAMTAAAVNALARSGL